MSEKEMNAYRFGIGQEPTDEMLELVTVIREDQ